MPFLPPASAAALHQQTIFMLRYSNSARVSFVYLRSALHAYCPIYRNVD
jgi:hypothetical protein